MKPGETEGFLMYIHKCGVSLESDTGAVLVPTFWGDGDGI